MGDDHDWSCRSCGRVALPVADGNCAARVARERVDRLLSTGPGLLHPQLAPLRSLLLTEIETDPYPVLFWLYRAGWAALLGELAGTHDEITHAVLDALPPRRHIQYLRAVLVNAGILPRRDEDLDSTIPWLNEVLDGLPESTVAIVRPYAGVQAHQRQVDAPDVRRRLGY
ncbi:hypothetical protein [Halostreptopolyspora alba]|uniref:hypothetical protein n=1 Tax=Halostreptopolyspora alba TaxID=2487137 RepID=UPI0011CE842E